MKRARACIVATVMAAVGMWAGAQSAFAASPKSSAPALIFAGGGSIDSLNPFIAIYQDALNVLELEYEPLTQWSASNTEVGGLASSWKATDGGRVWTYHLRPGLKWSDGKPITAADAVWTFDAVMHTPALAAANGSLVTGIKKVTAPNADTVQIALKAPQAPDPALGMPIVPAHVWSKLSDPAKFADTSDVVGSGPFLVTSYKRNQSVTMRTNPDWDGGKLAVSGVDFTVYQNTDAATQSLRSGAVDTADGLTPAQYSSLGGVKGVTRTKPPSEHYWSIDVNPGAQDKQHKPIGNGNPVLHDIRVRQAIQDVVDQKLLVEKVLGGNGTAGPGIIPPAYPRWYLPNSAARPGGTAQANKVLDAAGYKRGPDGIRLDKQGKPIHLRFTWTSGEVQEQEVVSYVIPWLKEIGIEASSNPESISQSATDLADGNYDLLFDGWGVSPDPDFMLYINTCANLPNAHGSDNTTAYNWCSPAYDKLYHAQHVTLNATKRAEYVHKALKMLYDAAVVDVLYYDQDLSAYRSNRFHFATAPSNSVYWASISAKPVTDAASSGGGSSGLLWGIVAAIVVLGVAYMLWRRRRAGEEE